MMSHMQQQIVFFNKTNIHYLKHTHTHNLWYMYNDLFIQFSYRCRRMQTDKQLEQSMRGE